MLCRQTDGGQKPRRIGYAERSIHLDREILVNDSAAERLIRVCVGLGKVSSRVFLVLRAKPMCQEETKSSNYMLLMRTSCHGREQSQFPITSRSYSIQATVRTYNIDKAHIDMTSRVVNARGSY